MRCTCSQFAAAFAILALMVQVVVAGLGGQVCIQWSSAPVGTGCASQCCGTPKASSGMGIAIVASHSEGIPGQSDCCVEVGAEDIERVADQPDLRNHFTLACATGNTAKAMNLAAPSPSNVLHLASHPPPSAAIVRATILRL